MAPFSGYSVLKVLCDRKFYFLLFFSLIILKFEAQQDEAVEWINKILIPIETADPDSNLLEFQEDSPAKFNNAKIFGYGEASHYGKEFFNIKAKFFKHLVLENNLKAFLMEESYPAESGIKRGSRPTMQLRRLFYCEC